MAFFCVCMSPALDATVRLTAAPLGNGEIFKNVVDEENVGGKAVNVARWLAIRGEQVGCGGILGSDNAVLFEKELRAYGINDYFKRVPGVTRRNEMLVWPGGSFKVNRAAFPNVEKIVDIPNLPNLKEGDVVVLSGSLPLCCDADFYGRAIIKLKACGVMVVLDASGKALKSGVAASPDVIKPNAEECEILVGFVPKTSEQFKQATEILQRQCSHVIISDGANGAWFDGEFQVAPQVKVVDTTSAGDTLLAEWCYSHDAKWAVSAGSAACEMAGSRPPTLTRVEQLRQTLEK